MSFLLTKWYLDVVAPDGETRIGYAAQLRLGGVTLRYASVLAANPAGAPRVTTRLRGARQPQLDEQGVAWRVPGLKLAGRWTPELHPPLDPELLDAADRHADQPPTRAARHPPRDPELPDAAHHHADQPPTRAARHPPRDPELPDAAHHHPDQPPTRAPRHPPLALELLDEPGALRWSCLLPRADVELTHAGASVVGTGYLERLTLRVPPWRLPIDELHWGRAHVGPHTVVWIDWRGERNVKRVFVDGVATDGAVSEREVVTARLRLELTPRCTLRDGDVAKTAFEKIPAVRRLLARNKLELTETKWLSQARAGRATGWAIHEVVRWA